MIKPLQQPLLAGHIGQAVLTDEQAVEHLLFFVSLGQERGQRQER